MIERHLLKVSQELTLQPRQVAATAVLLEEGATVPFIARYRKERTGELDEVQITAIRDRLDQLGELDKRRDAITASLEERKLLSLDLKAKIEAAENLTTLEDLYLPFRPKKRTRATIAKELKLRTLVAIPLAPRLMRTLSLVHPKERFRSRLLTVFVEFAMRRMRELAANEG